MSSPSGGEGGGGVSSPLGGEEVTCHLPRELREREKCHPLVGIEKRVIPTGREEGMGYPDLRELRRL